MPVLQPDHDRDQDSARQTGSLAGLAATLLLLVVGLYLVETLRWCAATQDCVLSGRVGCGTVQGP